MRSAREDVHIKEFGMWSYTESENSWLEPESEAATLPQRDDRPEESRLA